MRLKVKGMERGRDKFISLHFNDNKDNQIHYHDHKFSHKTRNHLTSYFKLNFSTFTKGLNPSPYIQVNDMTPMEKRIV